MDENFARKRALRSQGDGNALRLSMGGVVASRSKTRHEALTGGR